MNLQNESNNICPACGHNAMFLFYEADNVPVHSVLLMPTRKDALTYPRGTIKLGFCPGCGFISNTTFDSKLHEYSSRYEETQGYSSTFNAFHRALAGRLIATYDLHNKDIIEIGCGKGEFLMLLCDLGNNRGVGVDPAYIPERNASPAKDRVTFIKDLYSEKYTHLKANFLACKMTLEHIHPVFEFVSMVRRSVGDNKDATIFFQVPNAEYVLRDIAFWDIYYEHCSYFSRTSLTQLFRRSGFDVLSVATEYDEQYLTIEAKPSSTPASLPPAGEQDVLQMRDLVQHFVTRFPAKLQEWERMMEKIVRERKKAVIWGAGSKGVAFLTKLNVSHSVMPYAVDINPHKTGTFLAGTGQEIVLPAFLQSYTPDVVIIMNPIYKQEIQHTLNGLGVHCELAVL